MTIGGTFNLAAATTRRFAVLHRLSATQSLLRLASGTRINRASDDPAGLIASHSLAAHVAEIEAQTRVYERANYQASVADAALGEISGLLIDASALASAN